MASMIEPPQAHQQEMHDQTEDGILVLNSTSHLTLQRTIVEAFVKLVVCRKVTVQKVLAVSGHVVDSHTTQEEDSPVILDVHRHEVKDVCSALSSDHRSPATSDLHCPGFSSRSSLHLSEKTDNTESHRDLFSDNDVSCSASASTSQVKSSCKNPGRAVVEKAHSRTDSNQTCLDPSEARIQGKVRELNQTLLREIPFHSQNHPPDKKRKLEEETDSDVSKSKGFNLGEDAQLPVGKTAESHKNTREILQTKLRRTFAEKNERHGAGDLDMHSGNLNCEEEHNSEMIRNQEECIVQEKEGVNQCDEAHSSEGQTQLIDKNVMDKGAIQVSPVTSIQGANPSSSRLFENEDSCNRPKTRTEAKHDCVKMIKNKPEDMEMIAPGQDTDSSDPEGTSVKSFSTKEENLSVIASPPQKIDTSKSTTDCVKETSNRDEILCIQHHDKQSVRENCDTDGDKDVCKNMTAPSSICELENKNHGETCHEEPNKTHQTSSQPAEDDSEQDMLVIDISNTELERTNQTMDSDTTSFAEEHRQQAAKKQDHFLHVQTGFPPHAGTHDNTLHRTEAQQGTRGGNREGAKEISVPANVKQEQDDDCMITAAFINPARRKSVQGPRSSSQALPSSSASSKRVTAGAGEHVTVESNRFKKAAAFSTASHHRHALDQFGGYQPATLQQFQHSGLTSDNSAAASYTATTSPHTDLPLPITSNPPTSQPQPYLPNFLASTSQANEGISDSGTMPSTQEGISPIDYSQQTYQCTICCKIFLHRHKFERHVLICGGQRPFKCRICNKGFNQRAHLDTHMKFHMGIKRYRCDYCRKAYVMKGDLIRHLKTRAHKVTIQSINPGLPVQ